MQLTADPIESATAVEEMRNAKKNPAAMFLRGFVSMWAKIGTVRNWKTSGKRCDELTCG